VKGVHDSKLERFLGTPLPEMFRVLKPNISQQDVVAGIDAFRAAYEASGIEKNHLYPGVRPMLQAIERQACIAWIVTSKPQHYAVKVAKDLNIDRLVAGITGAGLDENDTKAELVAKALRDTRADASDAVMLGDRFYDMVGALENDVVPVGALWGYGSHEKLHGAGCRNFVSTPAEFQTVFVETAAAKTGSPRIHGAQPHTPFAISLSLNFWIFPVLVFGSSANTTWRGHL